MMGEMKGSPSVAVAMAPTSVGEFAVLGRHLTLQGHKTNFFPFNALGLQFSHCEVMSLVSHTLDISVSRLKALRHQG